LLFSSLGQKIGTVEKRGVVAAQEIAGKYAVMGEKIRNSWKLAADTWNKGK
jgi:hypothetical protein